MLMCRYETTLTEYLYLIQPGLGLRTLITNFLLSIIAVQKQPPEVFYKRRCS